MWWIIAASGLGFFGYRIIRFATADANLGLLSKRTRTKALQGKVVWIVGASQGLGEVLARQFAVHGARVIVSSRRRVALEEVKSRLASVSQDVHVLPFDLCSDYKDLELSVQLAESAFDGAGVDILVHAAGASQHAIAAETSAEVTEQLFKLNTLGPIHLTRAILPTMLSRRRGHIVVIASMAGKVPSPGQAAYSGAKMAVYGYFRSLAAELADQPVAVSICCPGPFSSGTGSRMVYGPTGLVEKPNVAGSHNVTTDRAVELILRAVENKVEECWIAKHPVLLMGYLTQYLPGLAWLILKKVGPKRARAMKEGKNAYDMQGLLNKQ